MNKIYSGIESNVALISVRHKLAYNILLLSMPTGSWFVLERWITDAPFCNAVHPAQSDLDVARGKDAKAILENHWNTWVTEADWVWLRDHGFNAVRIPVCLYIW